MTRMSFPRLTDMADIASLVVLFIADIFFINEMQVILAIYLLGLITT
jgi:hypothetical protein